MARAPSVLMAGVTVAVALSLGNAPPPDDVEWIVVPDAFGQGEWLLGSNGDVYEIDSEGWITIDDDGMTLTFYWPWVQWRPLAGGRVSLAVGSG